MSAPSDSSFYSSSVIPSAEDATRLAAVNRRMDVIQASLQDALLRARVFLTSGRDSFGNLLSNDARLLLTSQVDLLATLNTEAYRFRSRADFATLETIVTRLEAAHTTLKTTLRNLGTAPASAPVRAATSSGGAVVPPASTALFPAVEPTGTNSNTWLWVVGGVSLLALGVGIYYATKKKRR